MTTLTTRPIPLLPLAIAATRSMICNERSPLATRSGSPAPATNQGGNIMHPDNLLLENSIGVTSPRLSSSSSVNSNLSEGILGYSNNNSSNHHHHLHHNHHLHQMNNCDSPPSKYNVENSTSPSSLLGKRTEISVDEDEELDEDSEKSESVKNHRSGYKRRNNTNTNYRRENRNNSMTSIISNSKSELDESDNDNNNNNNDEEEDAILNDADDERLERMSCSSEDSELSVGQEGCATTLIAVHKNNNIREQHKKDFKQKEIIEDESESVDNLSTSISDDEEDNRPLNSTLDIEIAETGRKQQKHNNSKNHYHHQQQQNQPNCDEDSSNSVLSLNRNEPLVDPFMMAATMRIPPVPIVRPNPTRIQEEFLRKSHLYAEELMKQQMQFMAAARASAFSIRQSSNLGIFRGVNEHNNNNNNNNNSNNLNDGKVGFRPHVKQSSSTVPENSGDGLVNFSNIHSHLSAISKMSPHLSNSDGVNSDSIIKDTQQKQQGFLGTSDALSKLTAFQAGILGMSNNSNNNNNNINSARGGDRTQSTSPSSSSVSALAFSNHLNHYNNNPAAAILNPNHPAFLNNNLNETSLKFSIDNILKADFGRRITDPLLKRSLGSSFNKHHGNSRKSSNRSLEKANSSGSNEKFPNIGAPIDLTNLNVSQNQQIISESGCGAVGEIGKNINLSSSPPSSSSSMSGIEKLGQRIPIPKSPPLRALTISVNNSCSNNQNGTSSSQSVSSPASSTSSISNAGGNQAPSGGASQTGASGGELNSSNTTNSSSSSGNGPMVWPAWVYCTRYSDRPSSGPRTRKPKKSPTEKASSSSSDEKRPRTAFSGPQLARLKHEFSENRYLTERRRQQLSAELGLNEAQIKIWFQNKRAKIKKASGTKNPLALQLMAQGLYNHSTVPLTREEEELQEMQSQNSG